MESHNNNTLNRYHPWFESLYERLGLPFWAGVLIIGCGGFVALGLAPLLQNNAQIFDLFSYFLAWSLILVGIQYGARHLATTMGRLKEDSKPLGDVHGLDSGPPREESLLFSLGFLASVGVAGALLPVLPPDSLTTRILTTASNGFGGLFFLQFILEFRWALSAFVGGSKVEMELKRFSEDSFLGLKPFGAAAVHLIGTAWLILTTFFVAFSLLISQRRFPGFTTSISLMLLFLMLSGGLVLVGALRGYHHRMKSEKAKMIEWIGAIYTKMVNCIEREHDIPALSGKLSALEGIAKLQDDIHGVKEWPIDMRMIARAVALLLGASGLLSALFNIVTIVRGLLQ